MLVVGLKIQKKKKLNLKVCEEKKQICQENIVVCYYLLSRLGAENKKKTRTTQQTKRSGRGKGQNEQDDSGDVPSTSSKNQRMRGGGSPNQKVFDQKPDGLVARC